VRISRTNLVVIAMSTTLCSGLSFAEDPAGDTVPVAKDLTAVIALQGLPCGKVVSVQQQGENDYIASCEDGNHYRVFVNADGRVIAEKH
jgi:hypothetical protein